jgi:hypothetical protein
MQYWFDNEAEDLWRFGMNNGRFSLPAWLLPVLLVFVSGTAQTQESEFTHGAELLAPLKKELKQALVAGMQKGPVNAVSVCKVQAPAITDSLAVEGIRIGRTSHRLRNPANSAPDWVDTVLQTYLREGLDRAPTLVPLANDRLGYVEPITLQPLCATCHGTTLAPDVAAHIREAYPEDEATGFEVGDLRGVYWVEYPATE